LDFKTRLIGGTHWMAACSDLPVIGAMLEKTVGFQPPWRTFAEVSTSCGEFSSSWSEWR
jgi:hypothetical protein